mmetsp:Transcript_21704/g.31160  ORF Transcript_21704/g.31160 Transcript_21704/m.31160 type:complete len:239 (+) Transcript_21704:69-785(+)
MVSQIGFKPTPILKHQSSYGYPAEQMDTTIESEEDPKKALHASEGKPKRHITFYGQVRVFETIHRDEYTEEELELTWYKKRDFTMIKAMFAGTVQQLANGTFQGDTDAESSRGLEYRHREGAMKRKTNKLNALYAVLDEQERQWRKGYENDEELAAVFIKCNLHCRKAALEMGLRDEMVCRNINNLSTDADTDDEMSMTDDESGDMMDGDGFDKKKQPKKKKSSRLKMFLKTLKHDKN